MKNDQGDLGRWRNMLSSTKLTLPCGRVVCSQSSLPSVMFCRFSGKLNRDWNRIEFGIFNFVLFFFSSILQKCTECILQSADGKRSHKCIALTSAHATPGLYSWIPLVSAVGRLVSLLAFLADLFECQSVHYDHFAGHFVRHSACGQLLAYTFGRKSSKATHSSYQNLI